MLNEICQSDIFWQNWNLKYFNIIFLFQMKIIIFFCDIHNLFIFLEVGSSHGRDWDMT